MVNFLKTKGIHFVAFLLAFLLIFSVSVLPSVAQMDGDDVEIQIESVDEIEGWEMPEAEEVEWEEWEAAIEEMERTWGDFDDDGWGYDDDDYFFTTMETTTTDGDLADFATVMAIVFGIWGIIMLPLYIYFALTLMVTANKLGVANAWFAWIPILNIILMFQCAGLSPWLFLLMFIPFVNIILFVYAYMKIAERRGFESWLGILMILPIANLIIPGYLAWAEPPKKAQ